LENPLISIVTVCRNSETTIERAILSVINQTYSNIEYIIIDGGSTDTTCEIIAQYHERIAYFCSERDNGVYSAWNKGILHATGDYIYILNSDDTIFDHETVSNMVHLLRINGFPFVVYGKLYAVEKGGYFFIDGSRVLKKKIIYDSGFRCCAAFVHKQIYENLGLYNETFRIASDLDWIIRLFNKYPEEQIVFVDCIVARFSLGGLSNNQYKLAYSEVSQIIRSNFSLSQYVEHRMYIRWILMLKMFIPLCKRTGILTIWRRFKFALRA
jgi:glycosyltransferase involved in cell wall biosynthesis